MKLFIIAVTISSVCQSSLGFTASPNSAVSTTQTALFANPVVSRKRAFQDVIATTIATVTVGTTVSAPAFAVTFGGIDATPEESLRYVRRGIKALAKTELSVTNKEYLEVRDALRSPSLDTLRKYCKILIASGAETEKDELTYRYEKFVKDFESLDSQANLGVRGKKDVKMNVLYRDSLKELTAFADEAEKLLGLTPEPAPTPTPEVTSEPASTPEVAVTSE